MRQRHPGAPLIATRRRWQTWYAIRRIFPARWWRLNARDYVVIGALILWHMIGPNTSDDGYLLTMSRVAQDSDYTANYFRWYGAPEAPFGWYYQVFGLLSHVSVASPCRSKSCRSAGAWWRAGSTRWV